MGSKRELNVEYYEYQGKLSKSKIRGVLDKGNKENSRKAKKKESLENWKILGDSGSRKNYEALYNWRKIVNNPEIESKLDYISNDIQKSARSNYSATTKNSDAASLLRSEISKSQRSLRSRSESLLEPNSEPITKAEFKRKLNNALSKSVNASHENLASQGESEDAIQKARERWEKLKVSLGKSDAPNDIDTSYTNWDRIVRTTDPNSNFIVSDFAKESPRQNNQKSNSVLSKSFEDLGVSTQRSVNSKKSVRISEDKKSEPNSGNWKSPRSLQVGISPRRNKSTKSPRNNEREKKTSTIIKEVRTTSKSVSEKMKSPRRIEISDRSSSRQNNSERQTKVDRKPSYLIEEDEILQKITVPSETSFRTVGSNGERLAQHNWKVLGDSTQHQQQPVVKNWKRLSQEFGVGDPKYSRSEISTSKSNWERLSDSVDPESNWKALVHSEAYSHWNRLLSGKVVPQGSNSRAGNNRFTIKENEKERGALEKSNEKKTGEKRQKKRFVQIVKEKLFPKLAAKKRTESYRNWDKLMLVGDESKKMEDDGDRSVQLVKDETVKSGDRELTFRLSNQEDVVVRMSSSGAPKMSAAEVDSNVDTENVHVTLRTKLAEDYRVALSVKGGPFKWEYRFMELSRSFGGMGAREKDVVCRIIEHLKLQIENDE